MTHPDGDATAPVDPRKQLLRVMQARRDASRAAARYSLTATQEGIWLAEQADPGGSGYHDTAAADVLGRLDATRLRRALACLQAGHEALRCRVVTVDGAPVQVFDAGPLDLQESDLAGLPEAKAARLAARLTALAASEPFDLGRGPLWRARLLRLGPQHHRLVLVVHHLIGDGWSHGVLWRDLLAAYAADSDAVIPAAPTGYSRWLATTLVRERSAGLGDQLASTVARVVGTPRRARLPGCDPGSADRRAEMVELPLDPQAWLRFPAACTRLGGTVFTGLIGVFGAELAQRAGTGVTLAVPLARRFESGTAELIGSMVDLLPVTVPGGPVGGSSGDADLDRGRAAWIAALAGSDVPYRAVARAVSGDGAADDPITNLAVEELNVSFAERTVAGLRLRPQPRQHVRVRHDLTLSVPRGDGAPPHLLVPTARWESAAVRDIAEGLARRIEALVLSPPSLP